MLRPDGKRSAYSFLRKPPGLFVVAFDGKGVYLLKQYRYVLRRAIIEIPAGVMQGNNPLQNAKRELLEETGIRAKTWKRLGHYFIAPGHEQTNIYAYLATNLDTTHVNISGQEGNESIQKVFRVSLPKLRQMLKSGKVECGITLAALALFFNHLALTKKNR